MIRTVAVTGPTGAGKSRFCARLVEHGAALVDADRLGHAVLRDPAVRDEVTAAFGRGILDVDGTIDRGRLGALVFASFERRGQLDALVHPALAAACTEQLRAGVASGSPLVILEAAVYFLLPGPPPVDLTITVTAAADLRLERLIGRGQPPQRAMARIAAQDHLMPHWQGADRIITNDGDEADLLQAADALWHELVPHTREG